MEEAIENQTETSREEEAYMQALRQERKQEITESISEETQNEIESLMPLVKNKRKLAIIFPIALLVAVLADLCDIIFVIPAMPIIGAIIDLFVGGILAIIFWPVKGNVKRIIMLLNVGATFFEMLPFVINEEIPTFTIAVLITGWLVRHKADKAKKEVAALKKIDPDQISEEILSEESDE